MSSVIGYAATNSRVDVDGEAVGLYVAGNVFSDGRVNGPASFSYYRNGRVWSFFGAIVGITFPSANEAQIEAVGTFDTESEEEEPARAVVNIRAGAAPTVRYEIKVGSIVAKESGGYTSLTFGRNVVKPPLAPVVATPA